MSEMLTRRGFVARLAAGGAALVGGAAVLRAQDTTAIHGSNMADAMKDTSNLFPMDQGAARAVTLPPKPGAKASMTPDARDALEHRIRCQCGCTLDVYTCRTTDFSCQVSPSMHRDVMALVEGGYGAQEIIDAFVHVYGERVLMAPKKTGFNLVGWWTPAIALAAGAVGIGALIRRWGAATARAAAARPAGPPVSIDVDASPEELARLEAAVRSEE